MVLLMLFLTYLLLGASMFYHIEGRLEIERVRKAKGERIEINALLHAHYVPSRNHDHDEILGKLTRYCGKSVYNYTEGETDPLKWDFYNSFYFAYTVVSTIGYGNLAPTNMLGRILMIFYGLVGIPINGILLAQLGEFFGRVFIKAHDKYKSYKRGRDDYYPRKLTTFETGRVGLAAQIFAYLTPGFVMFIFFPAFLFSHYEGWNYDEAVYYAFVTLTTIGFGDYVAGQDNSKGSGVFFILYKTFLICWISFGLGYIVMIMTFIARGMRSKKITRLEHKLAVNLKHTQSKIWNEFNKEINYLRRVFNELQLSKVKRVYVDECNYEIPPAKCPRSSSFPDLRDLSYGTEDNDDTGSSATCQRPPRRRANSEVAPTQQDQIARVVSETDLQRIDKTATFATHAMVQPAELLARLVNILGYIPPATEDIVTGDCSNQTTLAEQEIHRDKDRLPEKEWTYTAANSSPGSWAIGNDRISRLPRPRSRAASEVRLHETKTEDRHVEWTWSGPAASRKIEELMKVRTIEEASNKDRGIREAKFSKFRKALISSGPWRNPFSTSSEKKSSELEREAAAEKDVEESFGPGLARLDGRRDSTNSTTNWRNHHYYTHTGTGNNLGTEGSNLLEETSLADFLRALTVLHATVGDTTDNNSWTAAATADDHIHRTRPRRKMGIASLAPPKLPSLFTLFSSQPTPGSIGQSNHDTITHESNGGCSTDARRSSLAFVTTAAARPRRFSLRPVATPISPPTPPRGGSPFLSDSRRLPYENKSTFLFESPKEPLIRTEGAPGLSSPIRPSRINGPRFSLRPAQNQSVIPTGASTAAVIPALKAIPRWKAGMLQRQIGQMNLRRRARAFSLSDVHTDDLEERTEPFNPSSSSTYKKSTVHQDSQPFTSPSQREDRCAVFPDQSTTSPPSVRFENKTVRLVDLQLQSTECAQQPASSGGNGRGYDCVVPVESACQKPLSDNIIPIAASDHNEYTSLVAANAESQRSLMEVKVESPAANPIQSSFSRDTIDAPRNDSSGLASSGSRSSKS